MIDKIILVTNDPMKAQKKSMSEEKKLEMNEATMIEQAINKISELLILGFG